jgi:hypothetical protein
LKGKKKMQKLKLTLNVDPATAVRQGKTLIGEMQITLDDADLEKLTPLQRETLARHIEEAESAGYGSAPQYGHRLTRHADSIGDTSIETLARLLDRRHEVMQIEEEKAQQAKLQRQKDADEFIRRELEPKYGMETVRLDKQGEESEWRYGWTTEIQRRQRIWVSDTVRDCASEEMQAAYRRVREEIEVERACDIENLQPLHQEFLKKQAEAEKALKDDYDSLYARLPRVLKERAKAGYAAEDEISAALAALIREDAGYIEPATWQGESELNQLSDEEFLSLQVVEEHAPEGATVTPLLVWDWAEDEEDEDGNYPKVDKRKFFVIRWSRAGIHVYATIPFGKV